EYDPESEPRILPATVFQQMHGSCDQALARARSLREGQKREILDRYMPGRQARWYKVGRALENAYLRFEIVMDIGSYRDLHRHRMMTQERQTVSTHHGFTVPADLHQTGVGAPYQEALARADALFRRLEPVDRD